MSRKFIILAAAVAALSSLAIASTIARSGVVQPYQTKADFDQAFERLRRPHQQSAMRGLQVDAVVTDEARKGSALEKRVRKPRLPELPAIMSA